MSRNHIEKGLIEAAAGGNAAAFNKIYSILRDAIYGFAFRMVGESALAEDITQETFIFFIEHPEKYQAERGELFPFLCGYARNRILHHFRKRGSKSEISCEDENYIEPVFETPGSPLKMLLRNELAAKIEEGIAKLPVLQREVILLRGMRELSYEEISKIVEADVSIVKVRLHRARKNLSALLAPYLLANEENSSYELHRS